MIYLYAITEPEAVLPDTPGLEDQPLSLVAAGPVAGLYSEHARAAFKPEAEALWRHDHVIELAMANGPVLPARFGTTFADATALTEALNRDEAHLLPQLERVRGCVELAVRVSLPSPPDPAPNNGREYVNAKLARRQAQQALIERTLVPLSEHAVSSHSPARAAETQTLTASYLVRAAEVDRFADQVRQLADRNSELSVSCTGPWPPYSFVGGDDA